MTSSLIRIACICFILFSTNLFAQQFELNNDQYFEVKTAYSPSSMIFLGKTPDTQTYFTSIEYGKRINTLSNNLNLYVTRSVVPFAEFVYPKRDNGNVEDVVYGFGFSPLGYLANYPTQWGAFYSGVSGGFMLINKTFPTDKGRRFNYTFDIKFGIEKTIYPNTSLSLGYRFHHISNAQTGSQNPGIDSNFLFISLKYFNHAH